MGSLEKIVQYLLDEADFNRSWADGRRPPPVGATPGYYARRIEIAEEREQWVRDLQAMIEQMDQILEMDDIEAPDVGENVASAVEDALCYLRDQWREAENQVETYRKQLDARCLDCADGEDALKKRIVELTDMLAQKCDGCERLRELHRQISSLEADMAEIASGGRR